MEFKKCDGGKINILEKIGGDYENFGIRLLNDGEGNIMSEIKINCGGEAKAIKREIIRKWISGTGKEPISWETLAGVLGDMGHTVLAQDIRQGTQGSEKIMYMSEKAVSSHYLCACIFYTYGKSFLVFLQVLFLINYSRNEKTSRNQIIIISDIISTHHHSQATTHHIPSTIQNE